MADGSEQNSFTDFNDPEFRRQLPRPEDFQQPENGSRNFSGGHRDQLDHLEFVEAFDEQWRAQFEGLLYLGKLEKEIDIAGHKFVIRTLLSGEKIEISNIARDLEGSLGYWRLYRAAVVAAGLLQVDGRRILLVDKSVDPIREKMQFILNSWYEVVVDLIYKEIDGLEGTQRKIFQEMGILPQPETAPVVLVKPEDVVIGPGGQAEVKKDKPVSTK